MESNGLLETVTKLHCSCFYDIDKDVWEIFHSVDGIFPHQELFKFMDSLKTVSGHNYVGFDLPMLKKLYGYDYKGEVYDTLLMSRILFPDRERCSYIDDKGKRITASSVHGVESWGMQFGVFKPEHDDWSTFSPEMLHRCKEDVKIQALIYQHLQKQIATFGLKNKAMGNLASVLRMETRVWQIIEQQAKNGWTLDIEKAWNCVEDLEKKLAVIDDELIPTLPTKMVSVMKGDNKVTKAFTGNGRLRAMAGKWFDESDWDNIAGDFCKVRNVVINLGSPAQVKDYLLSVGWKPTAWNLKKDRFNKPIRDEHRRHIKGAPKIPDSVEEWERLAKKMNNPAVTLMATRGMVKHRLGSIRGYIRNMRPDGRVEARANTCSTNTSRMAHQQIVNVPKADGKEFYGVEMRSLFVASKGRVLVGCDASALEARCEAHYVYKYDPAAAMELIEGDIHTKNADVFGVTRQVAKSGKYAILYGCSPKKLAETLGKPAGQAKDIYEAYWDANPALKELQKELEWEWKYYGYLIGIDGRPLTVRYAHALINTKFQSCGAVAMKIALCYLTKDLQHYDYKLLGTFHDEEQLECFPQDAEQVGGIMVNSIVKAGKILKLNVPLTGEYAIGKNWAETH